MITREDYLAQRETLFNAVVTAADAEENVYEAAKKEYEDFEKSYKNACERQANLEALRGEYANSVAPSVLGATLIAKSGEDFENLFCDAIRGNVQAQEKYKNAAVITTGTTAGFLVPEILSDKLATVFKNTSSIYADLKPYNVKGALTLPVDAGTAAVGTSITIGSELEATTTAITSVALVPEFIGKAFEIGKDLTNMTNASIINHIVTRLGELVVLGVANKVVNAAYNASGVKGVLSTLTSGYSGQVIACTNTAANLFTLAKLNAALGKVDASALRNACIYANSETIFGDLARLVDSTGRQLLVLTADPSTDIAGHIYGRPVKADSVVPANTIIIGDFGNCYGLNIVQGLVVDIEETKRKFTNYAVGSMQVGGAPLAGKGFAVVTGTNFQTVV